MPGPMKGTTTTSRPSHSSSTPMASCHSTPGREYAERASGGAVALGRGGVVVGIAVATGRLVGGVADAVDEADRLDPAARAARVEVELVLALLAQPLSHHQP